MQLEFDDICERCQGTGIYKDEARCIACKGKGVVLNLQGVKILEFLKRWTSIDVSP